MERMTTRKYTYKVLTLPKSEIEKLDPLLRKRYIMITSIVRDVTILSKLLVFVDNDKPTNQILGYAKTTASMFFLTHFISKIYEMWVFLTKNRILEELNNMKKSKDLQDALVHLKTFFSDEKKRKLFAFIRDKLSFHYEYQDDIDPIINEAFNKFNENDFQMILTEEDSANDIYPSLNAVIMLSMFAEMDKLGYQEDEKGKVNNLFKLAGEGAKIVMTFCPLYLTEMFPVKWNQAEQEITVDVPSINSIKLPMIVHNKENEPRNKK